MRFLSYDDIIRLHDRLIDRFGGLRGIRDDEILRSCVDGVFQTFDGKELYPGDIDKIVSLSFSLVRSHPFCDGNKRIAMMALLYLFEINNIKHHLDNDDIIRLGLSLAEGSITKMEFKDYILSKIIRGA
ncbi:MAG: Fic family protein [Ezakiella sp.]|nr:Fic family protein [Ezakiella sp.]